MNEKVPYPFNINIGSYISDPEGQPVNIVAEFNTTDISLLPWVTYDLPTETLIFDPADNSAAGTHTVKLTIDDYISTPTVLTFIVEIEYNHPGITHFPLDRIEDTDDGLVLHLVNKHTDCLAKDVCGIPTEGEDASCTPGSGCC